MKMQEELVSIIVPVYNAEKFLEDTIKTVQNQTYKNWELLLVDDCSTDDSTKIIKSAGEQDERIKLIELKENSGAAIARNTGIEKAKGRYIAFLDADDLWNIEKLTKQIKFMQEKELEFTFTGYEFVDEKGEKHRVLFQCTNKALKIFTKYNKENTVVVDTLHY